MIKVKIKKVATNEYTNSATFQTQEEAEAWVIRESQNNSFGRNVTGWLSAEEATLAGFNVEDSIESTVISEVTRFKFAAEWVAEYTDVTEEAENTIHRRLIVELAEKGRLPAIYPFRQCVEVGGLMAYGIDVSDVGHRVADLSDKILKGTKPGEIPIYRPTKFELSINLKTAKTLGIELPPLLAARADNVIDE